MKRGDPRGERATVALAGFASVDHVGRCAVMAIRPLAAPAAQG